MTTARSRTIWLALLVVLLADTFLRADDAETKVVQTIQKLNGEIIRDEKAEGKPVIAVKLHHYWVKDEHVKELIALKQLQTLDLSQTEVTDAGIKDVASLQQLRTLNLRRTAVTDAGLKELTGLQQLRSLDLTGTAVTDAGLKELTAFQQLRSLHLGSAWFKITDKSLASLRAAGVPEAIVLKLNPLKDGRYEDQQKFLDELWRILPKEESDRFQNLVLNHAFDSTQLTDAGIKELTALKPLEELHLESPLVTDASMKDVAKLQQLQLLSLDGSKVTNRGLRDLYQLKHLRKIWVGGSEVTGAGIDEFRNVRPNVKVRAWFRSG